MDRKKSNLSVAADVTTAEEMLALADQVGTVRQANRKTDKRCDDA
jgi:hypothetical protein